MVMSERTETEHFMNLTRAGSDRVAKPVLHKQAVELHQ